MAADIINLNKRRKAARREERQKRGDENAVKFGRTKAQKSLEDAETEKAIAKLDQHRRDSICDSGRDPE